MAAAARVMARDSACRSSARSRARDGTTGGEARGEGRGESWMERSGDGGAAVDAARRRDGRRRRRRGYDGREKDTAAVAGVHAAMAAREEEEGVVLRRWEVGHLLHQFVLLESSSPTVLFSFPILSTPQSVFAHLLLPLPFIHIMHALRLLHNLIVILNTVLTPTAQRCHLFHPVPYFLILCMD